VISTTFKDGSKFTLLDWFFVAAKSSLLLYAAILIGCNVTPPPGPVAKNRVPTVTTRAETTPPAPVEIDDYGKKDEPKAEPPYYGSTYWDELLTSVYYYPTKGGDNNDLAVPSTHLKFDHRDDSIWLCGDQRKSFTPGTKYRLRVTYEPNQPCVSNWKIE
jgi:hypothetical protein